MVSLTQRQKGKWLIVESSTSKILQSIRNRMNYKNMPISEADKQTLVSAGFSNDKIAGGYCQQLHSGQTASVQFFRTETRPEGTFVQYYCFRCALQVALEENNLQK